VNNKQRIKGLAYGMYALTGFELDMLKQKFFLVVIGYRGDAK